MTDRRLRKVEIEDGRQAVYHVPNTEHWAGWHDAASVVCEGVLVAVRRIDGEWFDADNERPVDPEFAETCEVLPFTVTLTT